MGATLGPGTAYRGGPPDRGEGPGPAGGVLVRGPHGRRPGRLRRRHGGQGLGPAPPCRGRQGRAGAGRVDRGAPGGRPRRDPVALAPGGGRHGGARRAGEAGRPGRPGRLPQGPAADHGTALTPGAPLRERRERTVRPASERALGWVPCASRPGTATRSAPASTGRWPSSSGTTSTS
ncbi:hypothetical protein [Ornithinimicrobium kibberense]|uniref:hypothetical protein n=1 Tax=Ornithinimicrobium kibberense TaxID=282060 RepID=UPI0036154CE5